MRSGFAAGYVVLLSLCWIPLSLAQGPPTPPDAAAAPPPVPATAPAAKPAGTAAPVVVEPPIPLHATSTKDITSELGGAFMPPVKCDADGNLYVRKFALNRPRGPVVKIGADGKPAAVFDPAAFAMLGIDRVDAFSPAADGGIYQIGESRHTSGTPSGQPVPSGDVKPTFYVLHYGSDGSPSSPARLDADFEIYTFAAFPDGNFLVSGMQRDPLNRNDHGHGVTKIFSADGSELAQVTFQEPKRSKNGSDLATKSGAAGASQTAQKEDVPKPPPSSPDKPAGALDLKDAEIGRDGNIYVMRTSSQALIDIIAPGGKIMKTLKISAPMTGAVPITFHVSENRLAVLFTNNEKNEQQAVLAIVVAEAQSGRKIAVYSNSADLGSFACYSANDGAFTFLKHAEGNAMEVIHAEP